MNKIQRLNVTEPSLPDLDKYVVCLRDIWDSKWITNNGQYHKKFERSLQEYLGVGHISLFANGTLALVIGLQALNITGEVITTPYSFVATTHSLHWNNITPVFCDINEHDFNINPDKIESLITDKTTAILPVQVYGNPCDNNKIQGIADKHGLKVIYDAAHAFAVDKEGKSILNWGDMSILSFHATKVFNTAEGGAIVCNDPVLKDRIDHLINFGFENEVTIVGSGINAKMNELIAAYGLLQLETIDEQIAKRKKNVGYYRELLNDVSGITIFEDIPGYRHNYSYFPILIDEKHFKKSRDKVYEDLKGDNIYARRYFYPLISELPTYSHLPTAGKDNLPVASTLSAQILCLPLFADITREDIEKVVAIVKGNRRAYCLFANNIQLLRPSTENIVF